MRNVKISGRQPTAIVSHDAGGAEILSSYVRRHPGSWVFSLGGPAVGIFGRKGIVAESLPLEEALGTASRVLCSASWQSDLEYRAVQLARRAGLHVTVFLDHWVNYRGRLLRASDSLLPDEVWVGDDIAAAIARRELPGVSVMQVENPFFADLREEIAARPHAPATEPGTKVLYVGEIIEEFARVGGPEPMPYDYTEQSALRFFLDNLRSVLPSVRYVHVRPHPAEPNGKYDWARREYDPIVRTGAHRPLLDDICDADVVVGCESMAMVVGLLAGKRVICSIPPGGRACSLPDSRIESLQQLLNTTNS